MRRVQHCLNDPAQFLEPQLVERQRQNDWHRETPQKAVQAEQNRILDHADTVWGRKKTLKPIEPHPFPSRDSLAGLKIPESDLNAVHGAVLVNDGDEDGKQQHRVELPVFFQQTPGAPLTLLFFLHGVNCCFCIGHMDCLLLHGRAQGTLVDA